MFIEITQGLDHRTVSNEITAGVNPGNKMQTIVDTACSNNFHKKDIEFEEGKVHVLFFWTTWAEQC